MVLQQVTRASRRHKVTSAALACSLAGDANNLTQTDEHTATNMHTHLLHALSELLVKATLGVQLPLPARRYQEVPGDHFWAGPIASWRTSWHGYLIPACGRRDTGNGRDMVLTEYSWYGSYWLSVILHPYNQHGRPLHAGRIGTSRWCKVPTTTVTPIVHLCRGQWLEQVPKMAACCHVLADACCTLPGIIDQVDGPLGCRHVA